MAFRDHLQELRELGLRGTAFRLRWELQNRGLIRRSEAEPADRDSQPKTLSKLLGVGTGDAADRILRQGGTDGLLEEACAAEQGRIRFFRDETVHVGLPIRWHVSPRTGTEWPRDASWRDALRSAQPTDDVKLTWEPARFPHAYVMARAARVLPDARGRLLVALLGQAQHFEAENPFGRGIQWSSSQELVFRLLAWQFAYEAAWRRDETLRGPAELLLARAWNDSARHIAKHVDYARLAVFNNHLLSEALGLFIAGVLLPETDETRKWTRVGREILVEQVPRQFYVDGGYIQQSHNYHRVALQVMHWACLTQQVSGGPIPPEWLSALARSVDFLHAHQSSDTGMLPNYGANDGALPSVLSTCAYADFRPTLQLANVLARGQRLYPEGPWDEEAAWLFPRALRAASPAAHRTQPTASFPFTGSHVLRSTSGQSFSAFRCATVRDRFSQIDMLHLDVWWRDQNVLVDGGSYLYNGPTKWHQHFTRTASHNTVQVDEMDQMLHHRKFKTLYWTEAQLLGLQSGAGFQVVTGEHYGFKRHSGSAVHRRSVCMVGEELWVVLDTVTGSGEHDVRLHWLAGDFPSMVDRDGTLSLKTPAGQFSIFCTNAQGERLHADVTSGIEDPPRGWQSRFYGRKTPVPSLVVAARSSLPWTGVTVIGAGRPELRRVGRSFEVSGDSARALLRFDAGFIHLEDVG